MNKDRVPPDEFQRMQRKWMIEQIRDWELMVTPISERLSRLEFYLKTLEEFIDDQEASEVGGLERQTEKMTEEQQSEFLAWNYPVHWDQIFRSTLRLSFLGVLVSLMETYLNQICRGTAEIVRSRIKASDLKGTTLEKSRKFLKCFGKFTGPDPEIWDFVRSLYDVRNVFVHNSGRINDYKHHRRLSEFVGAQDGISDQNGHVEVEREFCLRSVDKVRQLLQPLRDELTELCQRADQFEPD